MTWIDFTATRPSKSFQFGETIQPSLMWSASAKTFTVPMNTIKNSWAISLALQEANAVHQNNVRTCPLSITNKNRNCRSASKQASNLSPSVCTLIWNEVTSVVIVKYGSQRSCNQWREFSHALHHDYPLSFKTFDVDNLILWLSGNKWTACLTLVTADKADVHSKDRLLKEGHNSTRDKNSQRIIWSWNEHRTYF